MQPSAEAPAAAPAIHPSIDSFVALLELTATERPDLLRCLLSNYAHGPSSYMLDQLCEDWEAAPGEIRHLAARAAEKLDRLETRGPVEPYRMGCPDLAALFYLAMKRRDRLTDGRRRRRLLSVAREVGRALKVTRLRRELGEDAAVEPERRDVDRHWVVDFLEV